MGKNTNSRKTHSAVRSQARRLGNPSLPLRKTWPISLCIGLAVGSMVLSADAWAGGPTGGVVVGGSGSITHSGNDTVIHQASQRLALNWQTFNVGANDTVLFNQPSRSAVALNRILDQNPSQIFGQINSNGQVFLINTHGIIFGATAQMNVGGLLASTLDLTPSDFLAGHYQLNATGPAAGIVNHGLIQAASGGSVALVGGSVRNEGLIFANYGKISLDGAEHAVLDFDGNGLINIQITGELKERLDAKEAAVTNTGTLNAEDGTVVLQASATKDLFTNLVNNTGVIDASGINTDGGVVRLVGNGGNVQHSGSIDVSGMHGGSVQVLSDQHVNATGSITASGVQGGGSIRVGGGLQGEGLQIAQSTHIGVDARLDADATGSGDGGSIVVWGDKTHVAGQLSARGGDHGGDGGFIETSGDHVRIADSARISTLAKSGKAGTWLIDPQDFTIGAGGDMTAATLETNLGSGDVAIISSGGGTFGLGDINVDDDVSWAANTLTLTAARNINVTASLDASGSAGLTLNAATANGADTDNPAGRVVIGSAGSLVFAGSGALSMNRALTNDGMLDLSGKTTGVTVTGLAGSGSVSLGSNTLTLSDADDAFSGQISGVGGGLALLAGSQTLSGNNSYTGGSTITGGTLSVSNAGALGASTSGITLDGGTLHNTESFTLQQAITLGAGGGFLQTDGGKTLAIDQSITGVGALTHSGGTLDLNADVTTSGASQTYNGTVGLGQDTTLTGTSVTLSGVVGNSYDLTVNGSAVLNGAVGGVDNLSITGTTALSADVGTSGKQTYGAAVTLGSDATLTSSGAGAIDFWGTLDGAHNLAVNTAGLTTFGGVIGGATPLGSLTQSGGNVVLSGGITTTGTQNYAGAVTLAGNTSLTTTNSDVTFGSTVSNDSSTRSLNIDAGSGALVFSGAVGGTTGGGAADLSGLTTQSGTFNAAGDVNISGNLSIATSAGDIVQGGGTFVVGGLSSFAAALPTSSILLTGTNNLFDGAVSLIGHDVSINNNRSTLLGVSNVSGTLDVTSAGSLQQTGALTIGGAATLDAGSNQITLVNPGNDFQAAVSATGTDVALRSSGDLTIASLTNNGDISLMAGGGTLLINSALSGNQVTLTGRDGVDLGDVSTTGTLSLSSTNAAITASGVVNAGGSVTVNAGSGAIALANASNNFGGTVNLTGGATQITAATALTLGTVNTGALAATSIGALNLGSGTVTGDLLVVSNHGAISQNGALTVSGTSDLNAGSGTITLADANNDFTGAVSLGGGATQIHDVNALSLGTLATDTLTLTSGGDLNLGDGIINGALHVTAAGNIGQTAALAVTGTSDFVVTGAQHDIVLNQAGNNFGGQAVTVDASGGGSIGTLSLADANAGALFPTLTAVPSDLILNYTGAAMTLPAGYSFGGSIDLAAAGITLDGDVTTGGAQIYRSAVVLGGPVTLTTTDSAVTFDGTVDNGVTPSALTVAAGTGAVTFNGAVGGINGPLVGLISNGGSFAANGLNVGAGGLSVMTTAGDITQGSLPSERWIVAGTSSLNAGTHAIDLTNVANDFQGAVSATGAGVSLTDANDLAVASLIDNANGDISLIAGGALMLPGGAISAGSGNLTLAANGGVLSIGGVLSGNDVSLTGRDGVSLGDVSAAGTLTLASTNAAIAAGGSVIAAGNASVHAGTGAITLTNAGNDFSGAVSLDGGVTQIADTNALTLGTLDTGALTATSNGALNLGGGAVTGNLSAVSSNGAISQSGALGVTGTSTIDAGSGTITLTDAGNDFVGAVNLMGDATQITVTNALTLGTVNTGTLTATSTGTLNLGSGVVTGNLSAVSNNGAINQNGALAVTGASNVDAGTGAITLTDAGNDFAGVMDVTGGTSQITSASALTLGTVDTGALTTTSTGTLNLGAGTVNGNLVAVSNHGAIGQSGALVVTGNSNIDAGTGAITLAHASNDFIGTVSLAGDATQISDGNVLTLGTLDTGALTATSSGALDLGSGTIDGNLQAVSNNGAISQSGPLGVSGSSNIDAGSAAITLTNPGNDFVGAVTANGNGVSFTDINDLTIASLTGSVNGTVSLIAGGVLSMPAGAIDTGTGDLTLESNGGALVMPGALSGANITFSARDGVTLDNDVTATGVVSLTSGSAIDQSGGALTAGTLTGSSTGSTTLNGTNHIGALGSFSADGFSLVNAQPLTVNGPLDGGANVALTTTSGGLAIDGAVSGTSVTLNSAADITQGAGGVITGGTLSGSSVGDTTLNGANHINALAGFSAANFALTNAQALTVSGSLTATGDIHLATTSGQLNVNTNLIGDDVSLTSADDLTLSSDVSGTTVNLVSGGNLSQSVGALTAGTLTGSSIGDTTLNGTNHVGTLGSFNAANFALINAQGLIVSGPLTTTGGTGDIHLTTTGGQLNVGTDLVGDDVSLTSAGNLTLASDVSGTTVNLVSGGNLSQSGGALTAGTLTGSSTGSTALNGTNHVGTLGSFTAAGFSLVNAQALVVNGPVNGGASTALTTTSGGLAINGAVSGTSTALTSAGNITEGAGGVITAGTLNGSSVGDTTLNGANHINTLGSFSAANFALTNAQSLTVSGPLTTSGNIRLATTSGQLNVNTDLSGNDVSLISASGLSLGRDVTGSTVNLVAGGALTQLGGVITAGTLSGSSVGDTALNGANRIDTLGSFSAGNFALTNAQALTVAGPLSTSGDIHLTTTSGQLYVNTDLVGNDVSLTSADDLTLSRNVTGTTVKLVSGGNLSQNGGVITAGTLSGSSVGDTTLNGENHINTLGSFSAVNFALTNAQSLSVSGPLTTSGNIHLTTTSGQLNVNIDLAGNDVSLTSAGALILGRNVTGATVNLVSGGNLSQTGGVLTAGTLSGSSVGDTTLNGENHINTLGRFSAANFSLTNGQALTVSGPLTTTGNIHLATTHGQLNVNTDLVGKSVSLTSAGDLTLSRDVTGTAVNLVAGGALKQTSGVLSADTLSGSSVGDTTLTGENHINTLGSFSAANFALTNAQALTVSGPLTTTGNIHLVTTNGQLNVNTDLSGNDVSLTSADDLTLGRNVTGTTVNLVAGGNLSQDGGVLTASTLSGSSVGDTTLNGENHIDTLGSFSAPNFALTNAQALAVSGPLTITGNIHLTTTSGQLTVNTDLVGDDVSLTSADDLTLTRDVTGTSLALASGGAISQRGSVLTAGTLSGSSVGDTTLNGENHIDTLGSFDAANLALTNAQALTVSGPLTIAGDIQLVTTSGQLNLATDLTGKSVSLTSASDLKLGHDVTGTTVNLISDGDLSQSGGSVTAGLLTGASTGSTTLDGSNYIDTLGGFSADGFTLANGKTLTVSGPVDGGARMALTTTSGDLVINGAVSGTQTTLMSAGEILQGAEGMLTADTLTGSSVGGTTLDGANHINTLGSFSAASLALTNAQALTVGDAVDGGSALALTTTSGALAIDAAISGKAVVLASADTITEGVDGLISAQTLSGRAVGATTFGSASSPINNRVDTLGNFSSPAGFSMTNDQTLTLASVNGSAFTVDAGTSATYLSVTNGDLLQVGTTPLNNSVGTWSSTGRIGTGSAPIYVIGSGVQTVAKVGQPPAYFYALDRNNNVLPLAGGFAINVPTVSDAGKAQNGTRGDSYIDPSIISANYRSYGIVPSGVRLPDDQQGGCDPDQPDQLDCDYGDVLGMMETRARFGQ